MPIYAYRCESCGHAQDVIQKFSDAALTRCPQCGAEAFRKQLTAPAFQLKGSGWYVTDFRNGGGKPKAEPSTGESPSAPAGTASESAAGGASGTSATTPTASSDTPGSTSA